MGIKDCDSEVTYQVCSSGHKPVIYIETVYERWVKDRVREILDGECPVCAMLDVRAKG